MVPDFLVETPDCIFHVEVELTPKDSKTYEHLLRRLCPRNRPVLYVTLDERTRQSVERRIGNTGYNISVIQLHDSSGLQAFLSRWKVDYVG
jgi:hypothetical protein